jgi:hypothetical protein
MNRNIIFRSTLAAFGFLALMAMPAGLRAEANSPEGAQKVEKKSFGKLPDGTEIEEYTLHSAKGAVAKVITYGATLSELWIPDKSGKTADVVLGFDNLQQYLGDHPLFRRHDRPLRQPHRQRKILHRRPRLFSIPEQRGKLSSRRQGRF